MSDSILSTRPLPFIGASDYLTLMDLAAAALAKNYDVAAKLVEKLKRACIVADDQVPHDTVRMGSKVTFDVEGASCRTITVVHPTEIDAEAQKISVLTPVGVALLGLRPGQRSAWFSGDGQANDLTVVRVADDRMADMAF